MAKRMGEQASGVVKRKRVSLGVSHPTSCKEWSTVNEKCSHVYTHHFSTRTNKLKKSIHLLRLSRMIHDMEHSESTIHRFADAWNKCRHLMTLGILL